MSMNALFAGDKSGSAAAQLVHQFGDASVDVSLAERTFFAQDVFNQGATPMAILRPEKITQLQEMVRSCVAQNITMIARGGGLSYTDAYLAKDENSVVVDTRRLNQIVEINETDRYVIVEAGVTWAALHEALNELGLRTPYFGPLSGLQATIGGALSQGSVFLGSGRYGSVGDSVLALEAITADGEIIRTGSWAADNNTAPFLRYFGPDLTGVLIGDAGSLAIKTRAVLRLLPAHTHNDFLSFECADFASMANAMSAISRAGIASECFAFDPVLAAKRMQRASLMSDVKTLGEVVKKQGVLQGLKIVVAGRNFLDTSKFSFHLTIEADSAAELQQRISSARTLVKNWGQEIENSIPKVLRSTPFTAPNNMLGPAGERWVPVHGIVPHSAVHKTFAALESLFEKHRSVMQEQKIQTGYLFTTVAAQGFLLEPVFYWPDERMDYHNRMVQVDYLARVQTYPANLTARECVVDLKRKTADVLRAHGATHFQIGKFYNYRENRNPASLAMYDALKKMLDPQNLLNPGALR
jgi:FAD/FMN-containing dehydrogenase